MDIKSVRALRIQRLWLHSCANEMSLKSNVSNLNCPLTDDVRGASNVAQFSHFEMQNEPVCICSVVQRPYGEQNRLPPGRDSVHIIV